MGGYLRCIQFRRESVEEMNRYPFDIPAIRTLETLRFHEAVTFFVGENGSGKSTLIEAIAVLCGFNPEGGSRNFNFSTYRSESCLHEHLLLTRGAKRPRDGYFLRAESMYNMATYLYELDIDPSFGPPVEDSYGGNLHECSHGESFFNLMTNRLGGHGIYLFDEPESALSPQRQLAMLCRMDELVKLDSQLIIATHSPILLAYPHAEILQFGESGIEPIGYEQTEQYQITRTFLQNPRNMLSRMGIS